MMKRWRNPLLVWLACLALFATALPAQSWQCAMTGRIGDKPMVCAQAMQAAAAIPPCCRHCCKTLNLPPSDSNPPTDTHPSTAQLSGGTTVSLTQMQSHSVGIALPPGIDALPEAPPTDAPAPTADPAALYTQFKATPLPGRSPPVI